MNITSQKNLHVYFNPQHFTFSCADDKPVLILTGLTPLSLYIYRYIYISIYI